MGMMDYLTKKTKKLAAFRKLDELKEDAQRLVTDQMGAIMMFNGYFQQKYPGIEAELEDVIANQYAYYKAMLENEQIKNANPELSDKFTQIDEVFYADRIVKTGLTEKYTNPELYNRFLVHNLMAKLEENIQNDKASSTLTEYLKNSKIINSCVGHIALKEAVSGTLYELLMSAAYNKASIGLHNPQVNRAIDEYNQQYEYCYEMYPEDTKAGKYTSMDHFKLDKFEKSKYPKLLDTAFDPTLAKARAEKDLVKNNTTQNETTM